MDKPEEERGMARARNAGTKESVHAAFRRMRHDRRKARTDVMLEGSLPYVDSNPDLFDPFTLIGSDSYSLGLYYQIRLADIVVQPAMDFLRSRVESFPLEFVEPENPSAAELSCLAFVRRFAAECVVGGLESVVAGVYDDARSYGSATRERVIHESKASPYGVRLEFFPVPAWSIQRYVTVPGDGAGLEAVVQNKGARVPADKLFWFGYKPAPGAWVGMSALRPFLGVKEIVENLLRGLMERAQNDKGVPVIAETVAESAARGDVQTVLQFASDFMDGEATPIYLPYGYSVNMFSPGTSAFTNVQDLLTYFDTLRRSALMQSLENVGVTTGGNRALGQEFRLSDNKRFAASLQGFQRALNGDSHSAGSLADIPGYIARIGGYYGCRPPRLVFDGLGRVDVRDSLGEIREMAGEGIDLRLDEDDIETIRPALGLRDRRKEAREDDTVTEASPLTGIQVTTAAEVIRQTLAGELPRQSGIALLGKLGFTREEAEEAMPEGVTLESPEPPAPGLLPPVPANEPEASAPDGQVRAMAAKYDDIDFGATSDMASAAKRGLELRAEWGRGGTDTGVARARDISNRSDLSPETWRRMKAFFDRHEGNRDAQKREDDGGPTAGWIAWLLWGGDPGRARANRVVSSMDAADGAQASAPDGCGCDVTASEETPPRPSLNNRSGAGEIERQIDWDDLEGRLDRAIGGTVREIEEIAREHRDEFLQAAQGAMASGAVAVLAGLSVDYADRYADALRRAMRERAVAIGDRQAAAELRTIYRGMATVEQSTADGMPSLDETIEMVARRGALNLDAESNTALRTASLAVVAGAGISTVTRWGFPPTVSTAVASSATMTVANRAHADRLLREGPELEYSQVLEVMDRHTCEPCEKHNEMIFVVGSQAYHDHMPPYAKCASNRSPHGNRCRGWMVYLTPEMHTRALRERRAGGR